MAQSAAWFGVIVLFTFAILCPQTTAKQQQPAYVCRTATGPVKVDGQLDEPTWQDAEVVNVFYPFRPEKASNLPPTTVRLLWDESSIYIAWKVDDKDVWSYSDKNDDALWRGDIVELFIKPSRTNRMYYEIDIAPNGAIFDARFASRGAGGAKRFKEWNTKARIATHVEGTAGDWRDMDKGYTVEVAIPLSAFVDSGVPQVGTVWTFALFRCDYSHTWEEPLLFSSLPGKLDPAHGFHSYELYQPIVFESAVPK